MNTLKLNTLFFLAVFVSFGLMISCASVPPERVAERERPVPPEYIMGAGVLSAEQMAHFLRINNPHLDMDFARAIANYYIEEAAKEGVNHDIAFAQMILETGFLAFGNLVTPAQNNFAGLGSTGLPGPDGLPERGLYFPEPRIGVRAHIQHLKAYASTEPLNMELVNPRFHLIEAIFGRGIAPTIQGLTGRWATDPLYCQKITVIMQRMYDFAFA